MEKIIIIGAGWAGCAAAVSAIKARGSRPVEICLLERTDRILGLGNVGGIMRNNGRFTAAEENIAMGARELFDITDRYSTHQNVNFPGHNHASFYNVSKVPPEVEELLQSLGVRICKRERIVDVEMDGSTISKVISSTGKVFEGQVYIDTTGTTGPMGNCTEFGNGCSMCVLRCPTFGPRVSISAKAGGKDYCACRRDGTPGAFSGSCKLYKWSLSKSIKRELKRKGFVEIPLPKALINESKLSLKVCRQYALPQFAENLILIDTGDFAKMMTPFFPLDDLHRVPGLEDAAFADPYSGGVGNSIRYMAIAERADNMMVSGVDNLFCAGEKSGPYIGHTEAISTGSLAGRNAVVKLARRGGFDDASEASEYLRLPATTAVGAFLQYEDPKGGMITFAGDTFFKYMRRQGLYLTEVGVIRERINDLGLTGIYDKAIM